MLKDLIDNIQITVDGLREEVLAESLVIQTHLDAPNIAILEHKLTKLAYELDQFLLDVEAQNNPDF